MTTPVWTRGQSGAPPTDLASGNYIMTFYGNYIMALGAWAVLRAALNRTVSYPGGHSFTATRVDLVRTGNDSAILSVTATLVGFPWALLLVAIAAVGGGLFVWLSLMQVSKITESGPAGQGSVLLATAGAVGLLGILTYFLFLRHK